MAKIKKFEELQSWKKARKLTKEIYDSTRTGAFARDYGLRDQLRRASVSILSNIAEGFERGGDKEFLTFLAIAKGSGGTTSPALRGFGPKLLAIRRFDLLHQEVTEISRLISGFMEVFEGV